MSPIEAGLAPDSPTANALLELGQTAIETINLDAKGLELGGELDDKGLQLVSISAAHAVGHHAGDHLGDLVAGHGAVALERAVRVTI